MNPALVSYLVAYPAETSEDFTQNIEHDTIQLIEPINQQNIITYENASLNSQFVPITVNPFCPTEQSNIIHYENYPQNINFQEESLQLSAVPFLNEQTTIEYVDIVENVDSDEHNINVDVSSFKPQSNVYHHVHRPQNAEQNCPQNIQSDEHPVYLTVTQPIEPTLINSENILEYADSPVDTSTQSNVALLHTLTQNTNSNELPLHSTEALCQPTYETVTLETIPQGTDPSQHTPTYETVSSNHSVNQSNIIIGNFSQNAEPNEHSSIQLVTSCQPITESNIVTLDNGTCQPNIITLENASPDSEINEQSSMQLVTSCPPVHETNILTLENNICQPNIIRIENVPHSEINEHSSMQLVTSYQPINETNVITLENNNYEPNVITIENVPRDSEVDEHSSMQLTSCQPINEANIITIQNVPRDSEIDEHSSTQLTVSSCQPVNENNIVTPENVSSQPNIITIENVPGSKTDQHSTMHLAITSCQPANETNIVTFENIPSNLQFENSTMNLTVTPYEISNQPMQNSQPPEHTFTYFNTTIPSEPINHSNVGYENRIANSGSENLSSSQPSQFVLQSNLITTSNISQDPQSDDPDDPDYVMDSEVQDVCNETKAVSRKHKKNNLLKRPFICRFCKKGFIDKHLIDEHMLMHQLEPAFTCKTCNKKFDKNTTVKEMHYHIRSHNTEKLYTCHFCEKDFARLSSYNKHKRVHKEKQSEKISQTNIVCDKKVAQLPSPEKEQTEKISYACELCERSFECMNSLKNHILNNHSEALECKVCGKSFTSLQRLETHYRNHTGKEKYLCQTCHATFPTSSALIEHEKSHPKDNSLVCEICDKPFRTKFYFKKHILSHNDQTPFVCEICNENFVSDSLMRKHKRQLH